MATRTNKTQTPPAPPATPPEAEATAGTPLETSKGKTGNTTRKPRARSRYSENGQKADKKERYSNA